MASVSPAALCLKFREIYTHWLEILDVGKELTSIVKGGEYPMLIKIHVDSMKDAERLSAICREHSEEILLRADHFCVDPKSTLGVLAIMYSARDSMQLDTGDMGDIAIKKFIKELADYLPDEEQA